MIIMKSMNTEKLTTTKYSLIVNIRVSDYVTTSRDGAIVYACRSLEVGENVRLTTRMAMTLNRMMT